MLDTDIPAVSARSASARRSSAPTRLPAPPRPAPKPGRLARSEMRLLTFAVTATVIVCGLLVLYLAAYARVSRLGMDLSKHRVELNALRQQNQMLQANVATLKNPQRIAAAAQKQGMILSTSHTDYLAPRPSSPAVSAPAVSAFPSTEETGGKNDDAQDNQSRSMRLTANTQVTNRGEKNNSETASSTH